MPDIDVDAMVSNIEKYGDAAGPQEREPEVKETLPAEPEAPQNPYHFKDADAFMKYQHEYNADGKVVKEDLATILKRASQGYHYAQKMNQVNQTEAEWSEKIKGYETNAEKYTRFEAYAKENPAWYEHWQKAYESRGQQQLGGGEVDGQAPPQDLQALLDQKLEEKLKPFQEHFNSLQEQKARDAVLNEDKQFEAEVQSIRKQYPDIDFDATDPDTGKSLEYKVIEFGAKNRLTSFATAFKAFHHDKLVEREVLRAKDSWTKETQQQRKSGIIDIRSNPSPKNAGPVNNKGLSWDQAMELAAKDFGIGK